MKPIDWAAELEKWKKTATGASEPDWHYLEHMQEGFCMSFSGNARGLPLITQINGVWYPANKQMHALDQTWAYGVCLGLNWQDQKEDKEK